MSKRKVDKHIVDIKRWKGNIKGGTSMENVIAFDEYLNKENLSRNLEEDNVCEWDVISNIFSKAIQKKKLSNKQIDSMIEKVRSEVHGKKL